MKLRYVLLCIIQVALGLNLAADQRLATDEEVRKFLYRYGCSKAVEDRVEAEMTAEKRAELQRNGVVILSDYVVKDGSPWMAGEQHASFYRLINAIRLNRFFKQHDMDNHWQAADKCWSERQNAVIATKIDNDKSKFPEIFQDDHLRTEGVWLRLKADFSDGHEGNVYYDVKTEKYTLIDTGIESFSRYTGPLREHLDKNGFQETAQAEVDKVLTRYMNENGLKDRTEIPQEKLGDIVKENEIKSAVLFMYQNFIKDYASKFDFKAVNAEFHKYDDKDIDFYAVKKSLDKHGKLEVNYDAHLQFFQNFDCW